MWKDTKEGVRAELVTKKKEKVDFEIRRREGLGVIHRGAASQVVFGMTDNKVKIWNDMMFDPSTTSLIKAKMEELCVKKQAPSNKK